MATWRQQTYMVFILHENISNTWPLSWGGLCDIHESYATSTIQITSLDNHMVVSQRTQSPIKFSLWWKGGAVRLAGQQASVPYACISLPSSLVHERHGNLGFRDTVFIMYPNGFKVAVLVSSSNDIWCPSELTYRDEQLGNGNATLVVFC